MPLKIPSLDDRRYQELLDEAKARIPVHNPEWTNFNSSDPGLTLLELFAFMTENLLYRTNQIPERNRRKFLSLLGVPLQAATSARGLVSISNERGPFETLTLNDGLEVQAGSVPFRTERGLDVLPIEAQVYYKKPVSNPDTQTVNYYQQLYASYIGVAPISVPTMLQLYETTPFSPRGNAELDLGQDTIDRSLWIALLARPGDNLEEAREKIAGKTLSLGLVPSAGSAGRLLSPAGQARPEAAQLLQYEIPDVSQSEVLSELISEREPLYAGLISSASTDILAEPGIVEISLPEAARLRMWSNIDPLEMGADKFPPSLEDTKLNDRLITWLRVRASAAVRARLLWVGINATTVSQQAQVIGEILPGGTGEPDQSVLLSKTPVIPGSVRLMLTPPIGKPEFWQEIDDLLSAGPEVSVADARQFPGSPPVSNLPTKVFTVNPESGEIKFGDGMRGARPPFGASLRADYAYGEGRAGNVGAGAVNSSPALPAGLKVSNPVRTWGGSEAETVGEGEKQISRYLQHRDRLVSVADFEAITRRTPGVDIGRVEVIPAYNPELNQNEPGDAPGAVTLMVIPKYDSMQPDAPMPNQLFLDTICDYIEPRRLVTTEVFLRGPIYKPIWISVGISVPAGVPQAPIREAVRQALLDFLSPLPQTANTGLSAISLFNQPQSGNPNQGWPLRKAVLELELLAVASRVSGVQLINKVILAEGNKPAASSVTMSGLELPRVLGISVAVGDPEPVRGASLAVTPQGVKLVPVPVIPEECR